MGRLQCHLVASLIAAGLVVRVLTGIGPLFQTKSERVVMNVFQVQALALRAADALRGSRGARSAWVHEYRLQWGSSLTNNPKLSPVSLPRYMGAGETAIHKAIRDAERMMLTGQALEASRLLEALIYDLHHALETHRIDTLMDKWNARYLSDLPVDVFEGDVAGFIAAAEEVRRRALAARPEEPNRVTGDAAPAGSDDDAEDAAFIARLQRLIAGNLEQATASMGYESVADAVSDFMEAENLQTEFAVHLPPALAERLGRGSPLALIVTGMTTVGRITQALREQFAFPRALNWSLRIDGQAAESVQGVILPNQRLEICLPPGREPGFGEGGSAGPLNRFLDLCLGSWQRLLLKWASLFGREMTQRTMLRKSNQPSVPDPLNRGA